jgi:carbamate kinase
VSKIAVVAVGGNSLIKDAQHQTIPDQYAATVETSKHVASMIEQGWEVLLTHGNGPQVGFILRRSELSRGELHSVPLDYCGADTQGAIGYMFQRALRNEFKQRGITKQATTIITQTLVDQNDPAFQNPTKPIGSFMAEQIAREHANDDGWTVIEDAGRGWRRVVPSPLPQKIVEFDAIMALIRAGFTVIASGGGGIPVIEQDGQLVGVEAVIDKDYAAATLARDLKADLFLITTAVDKVALNFGKPDQQLLDKLTLAQAKEYLAQGHFHAGSMGPKVQAVIWFLEAGGKEALITSSENIERALDGETGTRFVQ